LQPVLKPVLLPVMGKIVFLKIIFYFKKENTILFSIFKIFFKTILWTYFQNSLKNYFGQIQRAVHKVRHARGGSEKVWQFVTGGGCSRACDVTLFKFFCHAYETWDWKWCLTFCWNGGILTEGGTDKNYHGQNLPDKTPEQKPREPLRGIFVQGVFVRTFCTTKNRGVPRCVTYFKGGPQDVWQSVTGEGGKNWSKIAWRTLWTAPK